MTKARNLLLKTPLSALIRTRCETLGLSESEFIQGVGYKDIEKGRKHLLAIYQEEGLKALKQHEKRIAYVLKIDREAVKSAVEDTRAHFRQKMDEAYRASFRPHARLKTERSVPSQITLYAVTGGDRKHRLREFEADSDPSTYVDQVLRSLPDEVLFFGKVQGFYINFSPDHCVEFDLGGLPVAEYDEAKRLGVSSAGGLESVFS